jgi:argininosuccinate lyase
MTELPHSAFSAAHAFFGDDARDALGAEASLAARNIPGGTGPEAVRAQIAQARAALTAVAL